MGEEKAQKRPLLIVIEGVDGSGKSTQIELLKTRLNNRGHKAYITHEPTDSPIGAVIRNIMKGRIQTSPSAIAALFAADRLDHIYNDVNGMKKKRDKEGYHIIASRYYFSSYAFQGEYVDVDWIVHLNAMAKKQFPADITIYLDVDPETCYERITNHRSDIEIYETKEKIKKVHQAYLKYFREFDQGENIVLINGNQSIEAIEKDIWTVIAPLL